MAGKQHLSSLSFDTIIGGKTVRISDLSATISDSSVATFSDGIPDGFVRGEVSCKGSITLDTANFTLLNELARDAGSWRATDPVDLVVAGSASTTKQKYELFGCLLNVSDLFNHNGKGGEKNMHKIDFEVTSPDFVRIDGVPYLSEHDTRNATK